MEVAPGPSPAAPPAPAAGSPAPSALLVALFLAGSGFAALVYQVVWMRELRLVFGASTAASSVVLALFMGGLGLGGLLLGRRADASPQPLRLYARLELGVALAAALSPFLIDAVRGMYLAAGGRTVLGLGGGTLFRLLLSAIVLGIPTFLMGGTLPAAVRSVERAGDLGRRTTARLYAANTAGAVSGAFIASFVALETVGTRGTLWAACLLNGLVAAGALLVARRAFARGGALPPEPAAAPAPEATATPAAPDLGGAPLHAPARFVLFASAVVGFAFLAMELVWYRMLAPILGGSSYTFGLILAVVLAGIALGGALYGVGARSHRPTLALLALTCALEAVFMAIPYAAGDRIAVLAMFSRELGNLGYPALVAGWAMIASLVVLPTSIVAGYQFPLLVALLGSGRAQVGRHLGDAYAYNTAGAIVGSLLGGFVLIPLLSAPTLWVVVVGGLVLLGGASLIVGRVRSPAALALPLLTLLLAVGLTTARGPTAAWRHSPIGAARLAATFEGDNELRNMLQNRRRAIVWEADGVESSVALHASDGYAFLVHGKSDGNARGDAATQVMAGLVGAALHPAPKRALVIGLGTGSTAGWLAREPGMERVDVVELEAAIADVARVCTPVNEGVLDLANVHIVYDDAREVLSTTRERYDIIFSEPSNPYRAGIASLFTRELYEAAASHMPEDGIFLQWLQGYEVSSETVRTVYATLASVFPHVETWETRAGSDLLLVASPSPIVHDLDQVRRRVGAESFKRAMANAWGMEGIEGFYSGFIANSELSRAIAALPGVPRNTDDLNHIEFAFARNVGRRNLFDANELRALASARGEDRPQSRGAAVDWRMAAELRTARTLYDERQPQEIGGLGEAASARMKARAAYASGQVAAAGRLWAEQTEAPHAPIDQVLVAEAAARAGSADFEQVVAPLRATQPTLALALLARWHATRGAGGPAVRALVEALVAYRADPWPFRPAMVRALELAVELAPKAPAAAAALSAALSERFSVSVLDYLRTRVRLTVAGADFPALCRDALAVFEPEVVWEQEFLTQRYTCYRLTKSPLEAIAGEELREFMALEALPLADGLEP
ncbi:MAG: fused MFS/spermidine synthase [Myxococcota bacterium]